MDLGIWSASIGGLFGRAPQPSYSASFGERYRYKVARLTPRYLAMSLPVCPSAFIRLAVAMCSASSTLRGRPNLVPLAREVVRSLARVTFPEDDHGANLCRARRKSLLG